MTDYEKLLQDAADLGVSVDDKYPFKGEMKGLYLDGNIALSKKLDDAEKACVLAEELGHHLTSVGNIIDMSGVRNRKQERQARIVGYNKRIGLRRLIDAFEQGCQSLHEAAEYLEVPPKYLQSCIDIYEDKYGTGIAVDNYYVMFIPHFAVGKIV